MRLHVEVMASKRRQVEPTCDIHAPAALRTHVVPLACRSAARAEYSFGMGEREANDSARAGGPSASPAGTAVFYRYRDGSGRLVIVDSVDRVPASARGSAEAVALTPPAPSILALPERIGRELHGPSFAAGAASALVIGLVLLALLRARAPLVRMALLGGLVLLGTGAYFGWVRRTTGQDGALLSSPAALIDDARSAVQKMNERSREQERVLQELEQER